MTSGGASFKAVLVPTVCRMECRKMSLVYTGGADALLDYVLHQASIGQPALVAPGRTSDRSVRDSGVIIYSRACLWLA
jgi:hypothetical protein